MSSDYWLKLDNDIRPVLSIMRDAIESRQDYIKAALIQSALMEIFLRSHIRIKIGDSKRYQRYWKKDQIRLIDLINYVELLDTDEDIIVLLRKYQNTRNIIVHEICKYTNANSLEEDCENLFILGEKIIYALNLVEGYNRIAQT